MYNFNKVISTQDKKVSIIGPSKFQHPLAQILGHLIENLLLDQVHQLQTVAQRLVRVEDPLGVLVQQLVLLLLHHLREQQGRRTQT